LMKQRQEREEGEEKLNDETFVTPVAENNSGLWRERCVH
jgi:hypothetical protein